MPERQGPVRDARRVFGFLGEAGGEEKVLAGGQVLGGVDVLLDDAGEVVDVMSRLALT